ncbi:hypothetical protein CRG98_011594 [Punica granatum]|uniref:Uncharacterized protein n=1 Tax=Punica granatum TaxID=22663 RepID=A0A2I0KHN9_PUNGR|nr:hypothetical protein CRG98_011594 [Punica granatum]
MRYPPPPKSSLNEAKVTVRVAPPRSSLKFNSNYGLVREVVVVVEGIILEYKAPTPMMEPKIESNSTFDLSGSISRVGLHMATIHGTSSFAILRGDSKIIEGWQRPPATPPPMIATSFKEAQPPEIDLVVEIYFKGRPRGWRFRIWPPLPGWQWVKRHPKNRFSVLA